MRRIKFKPIVLERGRDVENGRDLKAIQQEDIAHQEFKCILLGEETPRTFHSDIEKLCTQIT
ncbi:MAG: hypothetical protein IPP49_02005 [Saprospiraceae bacterium]|nr:hypothetical protein [Saprospiraceae bacterium]